MNPGKAVQSSVEGVDRLLSRELGVRQLAALIFNGTVGSGIFVLPAVAAAQLGSAAVLAYLVCALVMSLMVMCFAEAGSRVSATGGPYAYCEVAFGPLIGFVIGALLVVSDLTASAAVARTFAGSLTTLVGVTTAGTESALALCVLLVAAAINIRGVRNGARLVEAAVIAKLVPLVGLVIVGAAFIRPTNLGWSDVPSPSSILGTSGLLIFAFIGIEGALAPSGEVRNPSRTVPRAALIAIGGVTLLYLAIQLTAQGVLGVRLADDRTAPLATAAAAFLGPTGRTIMLAGAVVSMFGFLAGTVLSSPRSIFAFARDGLAPRWLAAVHPVFHTPHRAIVAYVVIASGLVLSGTFERLAIVTNVASLLAYIACAIATIVLRRRDVRADGEPFRTPGGSTIPVLACAAIVWLLIETVTRVEVTAVTLVVVVALGLYGWSKTRAFRATHAQ